MTVNCGSRMTTMVFRHETHRKSEQCLCSCKDVLENSQQHRGSLRDVVEICSIGLRKVTDGAAFPQLFET